MKLSPTSTALDLRKPLSDIQRDVILAEARTFDPGDYSIAVRPNGTAFVRGKDLVGNVFLHEGTEEDCRRVLSEKNLTLRWRHQRW